MRHRTLLYSTSPRDTKREVTPGTARVAAREIGGHSRTKQRDVSGGERLQLATPMFATAKTLAEARGRALGAQDGPAPEPAVLRHLFGSPGPFGELSPALAPRGRWPSSEHGSSPANRLDHRPLFVNQR